MMPLFLTPALAPDLIRHDQRPDKSGQRRQVEQQGVLRRPPHVSTHNLCPHPQDHGSSHHNRSTPRLFGRFLIPPGGRHPRSPSDARDHGRRHGRQILPAPRRQRPKAPRRRQRSPARRAPPGSWSPRQSREPQPRPKARQRPPPANRQPKGQRRVRDHDDGLPSPTPVSNCWSWRGSGILRSRPHQSAWPVPPICRGLRGL